MILIRCPSVVFERATFILLDAVALGELSSQLVLRLGFALSRRFLQEIQVRQAAFGRRLGCTGWFK